jgi:DNA-binding response OmpR family regulator
VEAVPGPSAQAIDPAPAAEQVVTRDQVETAGFPPAAEDVKPAPPAQDKGPGPVPEPGASEARGVEPVPAAAAPAASSVPALVPSAADTMPTILAVDDDENVVRFMEQVLVARNYKVITAFTGRDALAKVRESLPDLVILDGMLPEVHGFEICRQLKTSERFRHIPVVLVSGVHRGWRFAADIKEKYGADDYIDKPFDAVDFLRRIEGLLNRAPLGPSSSSEAAARQHLKEGVIALKQERLDGAVASFEKGLAVDPMNDLLHYYLGMTYEKRDMVFHAIDHYEKAIQINPDFYDAITALANLYQKQEFWRKAVEMWELALAATKDETVRGRIKEHLLSLL